MRVSVTAGLRVGMVDDHQSPVWGIERVLGTCADIVWVGSAQTVAGLLSRTPDVDVVVLDLRLADGSTPQDNVERLQSAGAHVLVYTSGEYPELLRSAAKAGVSGVVLKAAPQEQVIAAVRAAGRGETVLGTEWAAALDADPDLDGVQLSPQLQRVLALYAAGETSVQVAREIGVQVDTVHEYLKRIRDKYAHAGRPAQSKLELFKRAVEDGWLPMPARAPRIRRR
ncbi:two-component system response regulator [Rhodococcoides fascians]|uniref:response regulator transcription factor n=1 Tax=Rhodococcoides fascians TaxID=1828 RepID=UPI000B9B7F42|nr:two-component system response regulator [Rhodococcus fascians]OZF23054.1 two-component system response regulator [Rhodococcus fascians]OZF24768.1 two-component system response regulator [Rhodococcus fascians]OZF73017.1 two-component system response regulator [Rhodococcus fascians]OZF74182.1 two-component system response regulator [Rhodococcus fascians]